MARQFGTRVEVEAKKAIELDERVPIGWLVLGWSHFAQGRTRTRSLPTNALSNWDRVGSLSLLGRISSEDEARPRRSWLSSKPCLRRRLAPSGVGTLQTTLGNFDEAFRWFAYEPHHGFLPWVRTGAQFAPLVKDPRYAALLQRLKLPPRKNAS